MWSFQTLIVFMILLPGFITRAIIGSLTTRKKIGDLASIIESFILSFVIYVIILYVSPDSINTIISHACPGQIDFIFENIRYVLLFSLIVAIVIGLIWSFLSNHDIIHRVLRWLRVTNSTARSSIWLDSFLDMKKRYVIVTLGDDRRLMGYPEYYSNDGDDIGTIFLSKPEWIDNEGKYIPCEVRGILITKVEGIKRIEFLKHKNEIQENKNE